MSGKPVLSTYAPVPKLGWAVVVEEPLEWARADLNRLHRYAAVLVAVGLLMGAGILVWLSRKITKPIQELREGARQRMREHRFWKDLGQSPGQARERLPVLRRPPLGHLHDFDLLTTRTKVPGVGAALSQQVVHFVQALRGQDLFKAPGVAETLDWAAALAELDVVALDPATVSDTLGVLLKYQDDIARLEGGKVKELLDQVQAELRAAE
jgi:hypothetical protein